MAFEGSAIVSAPLKRTEPWRLPRIPMMARMVEVLPAPLRPSSVTTSPSLTSKFMPCRTWDSPYQPCRSLTESNGSGMSGPHIGVDDVRVFRHGLVRPFREDFAARQHGDDVG